LALHAVWEKEKKTGEIYISREDAKHVPFARQQQFGKTFIEYIICAVYNTRVARIQKAKSILSSTLRPTNMIHAGEIWCDRKMIIYRKINPYI
jgi:hypothetical protein